jgi:hypothetical protein
VNEVNTELAQADVSPLITAGPDLVEIVVRDLNDTYA